MSPSRTFQESASAGGFSAESSATGEMASGMRVPGELLKSLRASLKRFIYAHRFLLILHRAVRSLQSHICHLILLASERFFLWRTGLPRDSDQWLDGLTIRGPHQADANTYGPVIPKTFRRVLSTLRIDHSQYVFVNFGCGKGRAVLLASGYPFKRIIGVEFAKELIEAASKNLGLWRPKKKCNAIQLVWADVLDFEIPQDPCVLYFLHPFSAVMISRVLEKARDTLKTCPRNLIIVYVNPAHDQVISALSNVEVLSRSERYRYATYRMIPPR